MVSRSIGKDAAFKALPTILCALALGCAGAPSMVGFAHPEPVLKDGYEVTAGVGGGGGGIFDLGAGGDGFGILGGELSFGGHIGAVGVAATAWTAVMDADEIRHIGAHLELALPLLPGMSRYAHAPNRSRTYLLVGLGASVTPQWPSYRPQISAGFLRSPPQGRSGVFFGMRVHGGIQIVEDLAETTGAATVAGSLGYRWRAPGVRVVPSLQVAPVVDYDPDFVAVAGVLIFALGFNLG